LLTRQSKRPYHTAASLRAPPTAWARPVSINVPQGVRLHQAVGDLCEDPPRNALPVSAFLWAVDDEAGPLPGCLLSMMSARAEGSARARDAGFTVSGPVVRAARARRPSSGAAGDWR
jgi:hypothetical protein